MNRLKQGIAVIVSIGVCVGAFAQDKSAPAKPSAPPKSDASPAKDGKDAAGLKFLPPGDGKPDGGKTQPAATRGLKFLPPGDGKASSRIEGGASRGDTRELAMSVIAPKGTGLSSTRQPDLFWFVSRPVMGEVMLTVMPADGKAIDPLFEGKLALPTLPGIQQVSLAKLGINLNPKTDYDWSISIVAAGQSHSGDVVASGQIRVAEFDAAKAQVLGAKNTVDRAIELASTGYWYDVVSLMRSPGGEALKVDEMAMYESVGLARVVRFLREGN